MPGRYEVPRGEPARVRDGHHAPRIDGGRVPIVGPVIEQARDLFRVSRDPYNDPLWRHLRPELARVRLELARIINEHPERDEGVVSLFCELNGWLSGKPRRR